jgi:hypothetical protein
MGVPKKEAAMLARQVNVDFARGGTLGKKINRVIAFFNANIQGTDKMVRTLMERPIETMAKASLFVLLPSLASWIAGQLGEDDDKREYEEISRLEKDLAWVYKVNGVWVRIPKPEGFGMMGSLLERSLDWMYKKDKAAFNGFGQDLAETLTPPLMPTLLRPWIEARANYSFFTGRPIVPHKYDRLPAEMQYGLGTSGFAVEIGEFLEVSPMKVDHIIRGITGTVGIEVLKGLSGTMGGDTREATGFTEKPFVKTFFSNPNHNSESVDRFYEIAERTSKAKAGFDIRTKGGEKVEADKDVRMATLFSRASETLSNLRKHSAAIRNNKNLTPKEKRRRMDALDLKMIKIARKALARYDEDE